MRTRDPREYFIILQRSQYEKYDEETGYLDEKWSDYYKTFWLKSKDGEFSRRYSTESAPEWVMQIFNKIIR